MSADIKGFGRQVSNQLKNALNRTLTKVSKEQKELIIKSTNVKAKHLNTKRIKRVGAKVNDLAIKLLATQKHITPFMLENSARPVVGIFTIPKNKHFYAMRSRVAATLNTHQGFKVAHSTSKKSGRKYSYIQKRNNLDDEALKYVNELKKLAQDIFTKELDR